MLRWFLQIVVMLGDLAVFVAVAVVLRESFSLLTVVLCLLALWAWKSTGAFEAWNPRLIKQYLKNAKEVGL